MNKIYPDLLFLFLVPAVYMFGLNGSGRWTLLQSLAPTGCGSCAGSTFGLTAVAMLPGVALIGDSANSKPFTAFYLKTSNSTYLPMRLYISIVFI